MLTRDKIIRVDPGSYQKESIVKAADIIKQGGVVVFPTRCLYGLAADAFNRDAVKKIFKIKKRSLTKPVLLLIDQSKDLYPLVKKVPLSAEKLIAGFWPGQATLVFEAKASLPDGLVSFEGKIGIRQPEHFIASALVSACRGPITGTSANISDSPGCFRISDLDQELAASVDLIIDAGTLKGGRGSTIVDITRDPPVILRKGEVSTKKIFAMI